MEGMCIVFADVGIQGDDVGVCRGLMFFVLIAEAEQMSDLAKAPDRLCCCCQQAW